MRHAVAIAFLVAITVAVYFPARNFGFINFDDPMYVTNNPVVLAGVTPESLVEAFTDQSISLWTPLTIISYQIEVALFGVDPAVMHRTNIGLHALNAALLYVLLFRLTGQFWPSLAVAAIFAVHPTRVESVAWISERKDVLCAAFWMLTSLAWVEYVRTRSRRLYAAALALFVLGLLAKPMVMTLPAVLLLLDYWPLGRLRTAVDWKPLVVEKAPLFVLSIVSAGITLLTQSAGGAIVSATMWERFSNAVVAYVGYLRLTFYPVDLAVMYPRPLEPYPPLVVASCALALVAITGVVALSARRAPYLLVGWGWFVGTLVPVVGAVPLGALAMADRYLYIPAIGPFVAAAWGAVAVLEKAFPARAARAVGGVCAAALIAILGVPANVQTGVWRDSETLFNHALAITGPSVIPYVQLASVCMDEGRVDEAERYAQEALNLYPEFSIANDAMASVLIFRGDYAGAIAHLETALKNPLLQPTTHQRLGAAHHALGDLAAAERHYRQSIESGSNAPDSAYAGLLQLLIQTGRLEEAEQLATHVLDRRPESAQLQFIAGNAAGALDRIETAAVRYQTAIELDPAMKAAWVNLGNLHARQGETARAIECYERALALDPDYVTAHRNLALAYRSSGHSEAAEAHETRADQLLTVSR